MRLCFADGPSGPYFIVPLGIVIGLALPFIPVCGWGSATLGYIY
jgi:hypothetical protein